MFNLEAALTALVFGFRADCATPQPDFIQELSNVLSLNSCGGLFGIDTLATSDWSELTINDSSIVVPSNGDDVHGYFPVAFAFTGTEPGFRVHGKCGKDHKHSSKPPPPPKPVK